MHAKAACVGECACSWNEVERLLPDWATPVFLSPYAGLMHIMVFDKAQKRKSKLHVSHVWSDHLPEGSFYRLNDSVLIASPAFAFLGAAGSLDIAALVAFGCELCGLYSFDPMSDRGFRKRSVPLLTKDCLGEYLTDAKRCRGYDKAMRALPHVLERSASPMETFDALAISLPCRYGGYGLEKPLMNYGVRLSSKAARIAKRETCYADMCYIDAKRHLKLDIEHHGKLDHSSIGDRNSDRARVNGLKEMGFEVIELTKDQVNDLEAFEYIVQRVARLLGHHIRKPNCGATPARLSFRREVFAWNRSSGKLR